MFCLLVLLLLCGSIFPYLFLHQKVSNMLLNSCVQSCGLTLSIIFGLTSCVGEWATFGDIRGMIKPIFLLLINLRVPSFLIKKFVKMLLICHLNSHLNICFLCGWRWGVTYDFFLTELLILILFTNFCASLHIRRHEFLLPQMPFWNLIVGNCCWSGANLGSKSALS